MLDQALSGRRAEMVRVLDVDPALGEALGPDALLAREHLTARVERVPRGTWRPGSDALGAADGIGLLMLDGLLARRLAVGGRCRAELLGAGDILRPWQEPDGTVALGDPSLRAITPLRVAILDRRFAARAARWPDLAGALVGRAVARSRTLAGQLALAHLPGVEDRLLTLFWQLGERWGVVSPEGVVLRLRLSHELLGEIVGARRPTVTTALSALACRGDLVRRSDRTWLLPGEPPQTSS